VAVTPHRESVINHIVSILPSTERGKKVQNCIISAQREICDVPKPTMLYIQPYKIIYTMRSTKKLGLKAQFVRVLQKVCGNIDGMYHQFPPLSTSHCPVDALLLLKVDQPPIFVPCKYVNRQRS